MLPIVGDGAGIISFIHVDDAATAALAALTNGRGVYNIVDDEPAPEREWLPDLASAIGAKPPRHVPTWLARLAAGEIAVEMMTKGRGGSNAKATAELSWRPQYASWRDGFKNGLDRGRAPLAALTALQCREPRLEFVDPAAQQLQLRLGLEPALGGAAQPGGLLGAGGHERERHQPLRPVRPVGEPGRDLAAAIPAAQRGARDARRP
jgi:hypothetical protein